jgi:hypothetical protein
MRWRLREWPQIRRPRMWLHKRMLRLTQRQRSGPPQTLPPREWLIPQVSKGEAALSSGAPTTDRAAAAGAAAPEASEVVAGDGSPVSSPGMTTAAGRPLQSRSARRSALHLRDPRWAWPTQRRLLVMTSWMLGIELSLSLRGRMTIGVETIFWFISHTLPQCHAPHSC